MAVIRIKKLVKNIFGHYTMSNDWVSITIFISLCLLKNICVAVA